MMQMVTESNRDFVPPSGFLFFRSALGIVLTISFIRYWYNGWIETLLLHPDHHFTYLYFSWVQPYSSSLIYGIFASMILCSLCISIGFYARIFSGICCFLFTYIELIDKSNYLNHYYLISMLLFWLACSPNVHRNAKGYPKIHRRVYWFLRFQIAVVYIYAGLAKLSWDWLFRGEPLYTWLQSFVATPVIGTILIQKETAIAMGWAGAIFDLSIVFFLIHTSYRIYAFGALVAFHVILGWMFPIGIFPFVMISAATIFFPPHWANRIFPQHKEGMSLNISSFVYPIIAIAMLIQLLVPLRFVLYSGPVNWTQEGFRFSWRVMLVEKTGRLEYEVQQNDKTFLVFPRLELEPFQYKMMATQADMIQDYAYVLAERYKNSDGSPARIFAHSFIWFNGRKSQRFIDPHVDLASTKRGLQSKNWIMPLEE